MISVFLRTISPTILFVGIADIVLFGTSFTAHLPHRLLGLLTIATIISLTIISSEVIDSLEFARQFKFSIKGITVGWTSPSYKVVPTTVATVIQLMLDKAEAYYGRDVSMAVSGAFLLYREPHWIQELGCVTRRAVTGSQQGYLLQVGYHPDIMDTATAHELAHLILISCEPEVPTEEEAHKIMKERGWL